MLDKKAEKEKKQNQTKKTTSPQDRPGNEKHGQ